MKYAYILTAIAVAVFAQDLSSIPQCAQTCILRTVSNPTFGCSLTDFKCTCSKAGALYTATQPCITGPSGCSADDQKKAKSALTGFCAAAGITINLPDDSVPASSAPASTAAATSIVTTTVSRSSSASYPTSSIQSSSPTGAAAASSGSIRPSTPAQFTGAASLTELPLAFAGVVGMAAMLF